MKNILLIGTSMIDQVFSSNEILPNQCNKGKITIGHGGSIHNVSYNLACLDLSPIFITKLGQDALAQEIQDSLSLQGVEVHPLFIDKTTPIFQSIHASNTQFFLSSITPDFLFHDDDEVDLSLFRDSYVITDQRDEKFLFKCMINSFSAEWIISGFIPKKSLLEYVTGIVLNEDEFDSEAVDFSTGLKWIIVTRHDGATLLTNNGKVFIPCDNIDTINTLGAGDAFLSGLIYGLLRNLTLIDCIGIAHRASAIILLTPSATNPDLKDLTHLY
ncbi:carbohydrate kinase family protein [Anaerorhabdus sp.]|uniref:carbohydrate kinase family protein n=1 Tax=Anaerorhabdus sp. TaxID=1872524 RepID=UPI002FCA857B